MLNTPMALLTVLVFVVVVNLILFFGVYSPKMTTPTPSSPPSKNERTTRTEPATTVEQTTWLRTTLEETITSTATATATATPAP